jgi:hypothetical protein
MAVFFPQPITPSDLIQKEEKPIQYNFTDAWDGFKQENLTAMAVQKMMDNSDFPEEENYNPSNDPQLKGYKDFMHHFYFSKSSAETSALINKLQAHQDTNYASPWYYLGRITGAVLDPSTLLFFTKFGQAAKIAGTAMVAEEVAKQNIDPIRDDSYLGAVAAYGYTVPFLLNKLSAPTPISTQRKIKELDDKWVSNQTVKDTDIAIDGTFVKPNRMDPNPTSVGSEGIAKPIRQTAKEKMEGEGFIKSNLNIFGEDGPWTPVFRVIKQKTSLTAKTIMSDLLDTPLLKLKNTKEWGFQSSGKSIETDMRMMRVGEIESHKLVKDEYINYIKRVQGTEKVPQTNLGLALHSFT